MIEIAGGGCWGFASTKLTLPRATSPANSPPMGGGNIEDIDMFDEAVRRFICPLTHAVMTDPVTLASDGFVYERVAIEAWLQQSELTGQQISPVTRKDLGSAVLVKNETLQAEIQAFRKNISAKKKLATHPAEPAEAPQGAAAVEPPRIASIQDLSLVFSHLDGLREVLARTLDGWRPPQIVVLGQESAGKSTVLERLAMMSIFPMHEDVCTRCRVEVRLRNGPVQEPPRLSVLGPSGEPTSEHIVPAHNGHIDVAREMEALIASAEISGAEYCSDCVIVLHVTGPHVPSIDLVDLPGMRAAPEWAAKETRDLVDAHICAHDAYSLYLAVVPAVERPLNTRAMEVVMAHGLQGRTFGVFTKSDELPLKKLSQLRTKVLPKSEGDGGAAVLDPHGWVATMNAPPDDDDGPQPVGFERLRVQAQNEADFFQENFADLASQAGWVKLTGGAPRHYVHRLLAQKLGPCHRPAAGRGEGEVKAGKRDRTNAESRDKIVFRKSSRLLEAAAAALVNAARRLVSSPNHSLISIGERVTVALMV